MEILTVPIVAAIVQMLKMSWPNMPQTLKPILSLLIGLVLAFVFIEGDWTLRLGAGLILGLSASGLYSGVKTLKK